MADVVQITLDGDNKPLENSLNESQGLLSNFATGVVQGIGQAVAGAAIELTKKIAGVFGQGLDAFAIQADAEAKLEAVVKSTGMAAGFTAEQLKAQAAELQTMTRVGDEATMQFQALLLTFKEIKGDQFKQATKLAIDMATVLGTDAKGAAMQLGKALNDPIRGISSLHRAGVSFTTQQREMIENFVEQGDIVSAQKIILKELESQFGGTGEALAGTFAGKMEQFSNRWGDVWEKIGEFAANVLEPLLPLLDDWLSTMEKMIPHAMELSKVFGSMAAEALPALQSFFQWLGDVTIETIAVIMAAVGNAGDAWDMFAAQGKAALITLWEDAKFFFMQQLPAIMENLPKVASNAIELIRREFESDEVKRARQQSISLVQGNVRRARERLNEGNLSPDQRKMLENMVSEGESQLNELGGNLNLFTNTGVPTTREESEAERKAKEEADRAATTFGERIAQERALLDQFFNPSTSAPVDQTPNLPDETTKKIGEETAKAFEPLLDLEREKEQGSKAVFRGLEDQFKAIQGAAASRQTAEEIFDEHLSRLRDEFKEGNAKIVDELKKQNTTGEAVLESNVIIADGIAEAGTMV